MKIGFVIPWFGPEIPGGAEMECRVTARKFHERGLNVEILTTCVKDFHSDWGKNHHSAGIEDWDGIAIRRFKAKRRNSATFDQINIKLMKGERISLDEEKIFMKEMV